MVYRLSFVILIACGLSAPVVSAEKLTCSVVAILASAPTQVERIQLCQIAARAKSYLERCNIVQPVPVEIAIVENADDAKMTGYLGHYSPQEEKILLLPADDMKAAMADDNAFRMLPDDHLFASIVVHEMAHAFIVPTECGMRICRPAHEYISYAMQIDSLPEDSRDSLLSAFPATPDRDLSYFSMFLLEIAPERFAVEAWRHFSQPGNGCEFIESILTEDTQFPSEYE